MAKKTKAANGLFALLVPLAMALIATAGGEEPGFQIQQELEGRPANFFEASYQADSAVCGEALRLLNKPAPLSPAYRIPQDYAKIDTKFFLWTENDVEWEPLWFVGSEGASRGPGLVQAATVDLFNDGSPKVVFRLELALSSRLRHVVYPMSPERAAQLTARRETIEGMRVFFDGDAPLKPAAERLKLHPDFAKSTLKSKKDPWIDEYVFVDITRVYDRFYLLLTPAAHKAARIGVYLIELSGQHDPKLMCEFKTRYDATAR